LKVQPVVKSMESQKQQDLEDVQLATNCQVQRGLNGVGYCYFDTNNGVKVTADDYKLRYSAMINARRSERRKNRNISPTKSIKEKIAIIQTKAIQGKTGIVSRNALEIAGNVVAIMNPLWMRRIR